MRVTRVISQSENKCVLVISNSDQAKMVQTIGKLGTIQAVVNPNCVWKRESERHKITCDVLSNHIILHSEQGGLHEYRGGDPNDTGRKIETQEMEGRGLDAQYIYRCNNVLLFANSSTHWDAFNISNNKFSKQVHKKNKWRDYITREDAGECIIVCGEKKKQSAKVYFIFTRQ